MHKIKRSLLPALLFVVASAAIASGLSLSDRSARTIRAAAASQTAQPDLIDREPISPLPRRIDLDSRKVELGRRLFHETRFSADNSLSCASCHNVRKDGADGRAKSVGVGGALGDVNAPTVFNSGLSFRQFWDGRAETLEDQIDGPVHNSRELASDWPRIIGKLTDDADYVAAFARIYRSRIESGTIKDAIATYERSLITPGCRFDDYLQGDRNAITPEEKEGYRLFKDNGCGSCHQGVLVGGNMFEKLGIIRNYFEDRGNITKADYGRYNVTHDEQDRFVFKVPSLRNVARTAPYFHDASAQTLDEAVDVMARYQLGRELTANDVHLIVQFLATLTGRNPEATP